MLTDHNADGNAHDDITEPDVFESDLHNATCSTQDALSMWLEYSSDIPLADALSELPWIRLDVLTLTMECLASSRSVRVMKANQDTDTLVAKVFNGNDSAAVASFVNELKAYHALSELQGQTIPVLHSFGQMVHTWSPTIVTHWAGSSITTCDDLSSQLLETAQQGLQAMHSRHVSHGDIHLGNMLSSSNRIVFCGLGHSSINALWSACVQDLIMLDEVVSQ